jgi:Family of unknown function (DUF6491)
MTRTALILTGVAGLGVVAACAAQPGARPVAAQNSGRQCFLARQVNGYTSVSDQAVDVQVGANRYFRLSLDGSCPQSAFSRRVALRTTGGGDWICQGLDAEIIVPFAGGPQRCLVNDVQPISKAQWLADRRR